MTQNNSGFALQEQGTRAEGEAGQRLLGEAVAAYRAALEVRTRDRLPQDWAMTQSNLGNALREQGTRAEGEAGQRLLGDAVAAYRAALEVFTEPTSPYQSREVVRNLLRAYLEMPRLAGGYGALLRLYPGAGEALTAVDLAAQLHLVRGEFGQAAEAMEALEALCAAHPEDRAACLKLAGLYHERLFDPARALALTQAWVAAHPDDPSAQMDLAEQYLTTGQFAEARQRLGALLAAPVPGAPGEPLRPRVRVALSLLAIAAAAGEGDVAAVEAQAAALQAYLATLPAEGAEGGWSFAGTLHFIAGRPEFAPYPWLAEAITRAQAGDWAGVAGALGRR